VTDSEQFYDRIGGGYSTTRRADPRIEEQIHRALGDAATVVNVGAGAGAYEPREIGEAQVDLGYRLLIADYI